MLIQIIFKIHSGSCAKLLLIRNTLTSEQVSENYGSILYCALYYSKLVPNNYFPMTKFYAMFVFMFKYETNEIFILLHNSHSASSVERRDGRKKRGRNKKTF
jgi:hypothetical protein